MPLKKAAVSKQSPDPKSVKAQQNLMGELFAKMEDGSIHKDLSRKIKACADKSGVPVDDSVVKSTFEFSREVEATHKELEHHKKESTQEREALRKQLEMALSAANSAGYGDVVKQLKLNLDEDLPSAVKDIEVIAKKDKTGKIKEFMSSIKDKVKTINHRSKTIEKLEKKHEKLEKQKSKKVSAFKKRIMEFNNIKFSKGKNDTLKRQLYKEKLDLLYTFFVGFKSDVAQYYEDLGEHDFWVAPIEPLFGFSKTSWADKHFSATKRWLVSTKKELHNFDKLKGKISKIYSEEAEKEDTILIKKLKKEWAKIFSSAKLENKLSLPEEITISRRSAINDVKDILVEIAHMFD